MYSLFGRPLQEKDFATPEARAEIFKILNFTASGKRFEKEIKKRDAVLQAFGSAGDFETTIHEILRKYQALPLFDNGYEQIFDMIDATNSNDDGFTIYDVEDALTFAKVPIGEKAEVFGMSGTKAEVSYDIYGAGLQWHRTLIEDRKFWQLENNARTFINKANYTKAAAFYALLEAVGSGRNITWQACIPASLSTSDATYYANRDAQTMIAAAEKIFDDVKDKGYGVTFNTPLVIVTPYQLIGRLNRAMGLVLQGFAGSPSQVGYSFRVVPTQMFSVATSYYVCLPKNKLVGGNRMNLTIFDQFAPESYSDTSYGWMRFGGAVGDQEQICRCAIS